MTAAVPLRSPNGWLTQHATAKNSGACSRLRSTILLYNIAQTPDGDQTQRSPKFLTGGAGNSLLHVILGNQRTR